MGVICFLENIHILTFPGAIIEDLEGVGILALDQNGQPGFFMGDDWIGAVEVDDDGEVLNEMPELGDVEEDNDLPPIEWTEDGLEWFKGSGGGYDPEWGGKRTSDQYYNDDVNPEDYGEDICPDCTEDWQCPWCSMKSLEISPPKLQHRDQNVVAVPKKYNFGASSSSSSSSSKTNYSSYRDERDNDD